MCHDCQGSFLKKCYRSFVYRLCGISMCENMYVSASVCICFVLFFWPFVFCLVCLFCHILVYLFLLYLILLVLILDACLYFNVCEKGGGDLGRWGSGKDKGGAEGGETVI